MAFFYPLLKNGCFWLRDCLLIDIIEHPMEVLDFPIFMADQKGRQKCYTFE